MNMAICSQCGESAVVGGFSSIPGKEINESWRCMGCLMWEVREYNTAHGLEMKNVLIVRPDDVP
jgi:hypothetical protein